jgi:hypothetical protein
MERDAFTWVGAAVMAVAGALASGVPPAAAPLHEDNRRVAERPRQPTLLGSTVYAAEQGMRQITVWRRDVDPPPAVAVLRYLKEHPDRNALPNVVLYAMDAPVDAPSAQRLVWTATDYFASSSPGWPDFRADVLVHPGTRQTYIALMKSVALQSTFSLYAVDSGASIAADPANLSPASIAKWPDGQAPLATLEKDVGDEHACGLASLRLVGTGRGLLLAATRDHASCPPVFIEVDSAANSWREVTLAPAR